MILIDHVFFTIQVHNVRDHTLANRMESFFLAETLKYLYLLFEDDSFVHNTGGRGTVIETTNGECLIDSGFYVFNTEAHPIDGAAVRCCSRKKSDDEQLKHIHEDIDLLSMIDGPYNLDSMESENRENDNNLFLTFMDPESSLKTDIGSVDSSGASGEAAPNEPVDDDDADAETKPVSPESRADGPIHSIASLHCQSRPFHSRFSIDAEMFEDLGNG